MGRNGEVECCMCGDHGLSSELFKCSSCGFRSQHKYCSNLYPRAESYHTCNWCLSQKNLEKGDETATKMPSRNSPSIKSRTDHREMKIKKIKRDDDHGGGGTVDERIKKLSKLPAEEEAAAAGRKRLAGGGIPVRVGKRNRSEEGGKGGRIIRPVFRNRVRRYKLLDEVSSKFT